MELPTPCPLPKHRHLRRAELWWDSEEFSVTRNEGAAGIARVDRCVGLQHGDTVKVFRLFRHADDAGGCADTFAERIADRINRGAVKA